MLYKKSKNYIKRLNYKDLLIIFGIWYFIMLFNYLINDFNLPYTPNLTGALHFSFLFTGRCLFLGLITFYLVSLYSVTFSDLGLKLSNFKSQISTWIYLVIFLLSAILIFINIPLSYNSLSTEFLPVYKIKSVENFIKSLLPLIIIFIPGSVIALSEQFILNSIVFEIFNFKIPSIIAIIFSSLFYSVVILTFSPGKILINFIIAFISIYLYIRSNRSLLLSTLFMATYYTLYISYIYGWKYLFF